MHHQRHHQDEGSTAAGYLERGLRVEALDNETRADLAHLEGRVLQAAHEWGSRGGGRAHDGEEDRPEEVGRKLHSGQSLQP